MRNQLFHGVGGARYPDVSHAAGADGAFWKISTDVLHLVAASIWVGGLIHIGLAMPRWLDELTGPAVIEEAMSTTLVHPGERVEVDDYGNILIHVAAT